MQISVESLREVGAFAGQPVKKTIEWTQIDDDGNEQQFSAFTYIRRDSCASFERQARSLSEGRETVATRIASSVCDENGALVFTYEQALELRDTISAALFKAIIEVNPARAKKRLPPMTNSGASSSSTESAAGRSRKQKAGSLRKKLASGSPTSSSEEA